MNELKKWFRKLCVDNNTTQSEMAKKIGISDAYLSAILNGERRITRKVYNLMTKTLDLSDEDCELLHNYMQPYKEKQIASLEEARTRIAELEEQLRSGMHLKYRVGQTVWFIDKYNGILRSDTIGSIDIEEDDVEYFMANDCGWAPCYFENELFSTLEEAQSKLKELEESK